MNNPTYAEFRQVFFRDFFPHATTEQMMAEWLNLQLDNRMVDEYEMEFSLLLQFTGEGYRDNDQMKVQKFQNGLNPEIHHDVKMFELTTLSAAVHKAQVVERNKVECKKQTASSKP